MENMLDIATEAFLFLFKRITRLSGNKKEIVQFAEVEQKQQQFIKDAQLVEIIRCITRLLITIAVVVLVIKTDIAKLGMVLVFVLFSMFLYMGLKD